MCLKICCCEPIRTSSNCPVGLLKNAVIKYPGVGITIAQLAWYLKYIVYTKIKMTFVILGYNKYSLAASNGLAAKGLHFSHPHRELSIERDLGSLSHLLVWLHILETMIAICTQLCTMYVILVRRTRPQPPLTLCSYIQYKYSQLGGEGLRVRLTRITIIVSSIYVQPHPQIREESEISLNDGKLAARMTEMQPLLLVGISH